jgi:hypothetical protein
MLRGELRQKPTDVPKMFTDTHDPGDGGSKQHPKQFLSRTRCSSDTSVDSEKTQSGPTRHVSMGVAVSNVPWDTVRFPYAKVKRCSVQLHKNRGKQQVVET